jgi:hypothetical protein
MGIHDFGGGVRIPAGSCAVHSNTPRAQIFSGSGGLTAYNPDGSIDVICVCQLPVPERALIRQFVVVGNLSTGQIDVELGGVSWNVPRQHSQYASLRMLPSTPFEIPDMQQRKVVQNLSTSDSDSLRTDRAVCYFIQARMHSDSPVSFEQSLEIFYFEVYWD